MRAGAEIPLEEFLAGFTPERAQRLREDIAAGIRRKIVAKRPGETWTLYELDPEWGVARVVKVGAND